LGDVTVTFKPPKQKRKKVVRDCPITDELYELILKFQGNQPSSNNLFKSTDSWLQQKLNKILKPFSHTTHDLRHGRATDLNNSGMGLVELQNFLGHSDPKTTSRYITVKNEEILSKVKRATK